MARKRDLVKLLSKFTTDELEAEIARRHNTGSGKVWGYVVCDPDEDDNGDPRVRIVTEEYWKETGCTFDYSLGDMVRLPEGFYEVCEAEYEFREGDLSYAEELLQKAGFKRLGEE